MIGYSKYTKIKQEKFRFIIRLQYNIVRAILKKDRSKFQKFLYWDLNSGNGVHQSTGELGSPLIALQEIKMPCVAVFFEKIKKDCKKLHSNIINSISHHSYASTIETGFIGGNENLDYEIIRGDYIENPKLIEQFLVRRYHREYGLLYHDPNGAPELKLLEKISKDQRFSTTDFLINCNANGLKKAIGASKSERCSHLKFKQFEPLDIGLSKVKKKYWLINRQEFGIFQWVFLFGTNYSGHLDNFHKIGMIDLDSPEGQETLKRISYKKETKNDT